MALCSDQAYPVLSERIESYADKVLSEVKRRIQTGKIKQKQLNSCTCTLIVDGCGVNDNNECFNNNVEVEENNIW